MSRPLKGFITYAHKNTTAKDELIMRVAVMQQQNELVTWHDAEMTGGTKWREDIFKHLADSDILLYLVSAASLASQNCNKELAEAISSDIRIIPIILEHCDWKHHQLSEFQAFPDRGKPISEWQPEDRGWQDVVEGIRKTIDKMQVQVDSSSHASEKELRAELAFQHGNVFMMLGQMNKAIEAYSRAIELNPNNANTHHNRGVAYCSKGNYDYAIEDFGTVIKLKPNDADGYNSRGEVYSNKREYDGAIADFSKAIGLNPNDANTYYNRGTIYCNKGNYDGAIADFDIAIELNPNDAYAYSNRGTAYTNKRELAKAIVDYTKVIELNPNDAIAYNNRGGVYYLKGEYESAIVDFTKTIELNPSDAIAYNNRGVAYHLKEEYGSAIADFTRAIELDPNYAIAYNNRGRAYRLKGEVDSSTTRPDSPTSKHAVIRTIKDYNSAIGLNPELAPAYYNRGVAWLRLREWERAKSDLTIAREMGISIIAEFRNDYDSVESFERRNGVQLPEDIVAMLL